MTVEEIDLWANALGTTREAILAEQDGNALPPASQGKDYLMKYVQELEERVKEQARTIEVLLGKSEGVLENSRLVLFYFLDLWHKSGYTLHAYVA